MAKWFRADKRSSPQPSKAPSLNRVALPKAASGSNRRETGGNGQTAYLPPSIEIFDRLEADSNCSGVAGTPARPSQNRGQILEMECVRGSLAPILSSHNQLRPRAQVVDRRPPPLLLPSVE
jgi:hypothetical protein